MTTRAKLEADIENLEGLRDSLLLCGQIEPVERISLDCAIARLRRDLAKIDGPADGFVRVRIGVSVANYGGWVAFGSGDADMDTIEESTDHAPGDLMSWVTADVPKPVPKAGEEIEGEVCNGQ